MTQNHTIFVCGNEEILADCTIFPHIGGAGGALNDVVGAAAAIIERGQADCSVERVFRDWSGGRFDQFYTRYGRFVATHKDAPKWVARLAEKASAAMDDELDRQDVAALGRERNRIAAAMAEDEDRSPRWIIEKIIMPEADFDQHTRASIIAALRENDPSLLVAIAALA